MGPPTSINFQCDVRTLQRWSVSVKDRGLFAPYQDTSLLTRSVVSTAQSIIHWKVDIEVSACVLLDTWYITLNGT